MRPFRTIGLLFLAGVLASCGVNPQSEPSKIDLKTPTTTPTPRVSQNRCPPTPTATRAASATPASTAAIAAPCDMATSAPDVSSAPASSVGVPGGGSRAPSAVPRRP